MAGHAYQAQKLFQMFHSRLCTIDVLGMGTIEDLGGERPTHPTRLLAGDHGCCLPCVQVNAMLQALQAEDGQIFATDEAAQEGAGLAELSSCLPDEVDPQVGAVRSCPQRQSCMASTSAELVMVSCLTRTCTGRRDICRERHTLCDGPNLSMQGSKQMLQAHNRFRQAEAEVLAELDGLHAQGARTEAGDTGPQPWPTGDRRM